MKAKLQGVVFRHFHLMLLIALFVIFSLTASNFWSITKWDNIANIILKQAPFSILMALCMTISIILGGMDLSIGASVALISCAAGKTLQITGNPLLGILVSLALGLLIGLCNGLLVAKIRLPIFIATYSMKWILQGLALIVTGGQQVFGFGKAYTELFTASPYTMLAICIVICVVVSVVFNRTNFGKKLYATGSNQSAASFSGIRVATVKILAFSMSGVIMAFVSMMYIANLNATDPTTGGSFAINAVAATLIGGTAMGGGNGKTSNAVIGALIFLVLTNGLILLGVPSLWQDVVIGCVILLSVALERLLQHFVPESV